MNHRFEEALATQSALVKAINYIAATLGIGSFLGLVNLAVGVLSAIWLSVQLYGYVRYELPIKHYRREQARRAAERMAADNTDCGLPEDRP